MDINDLIQKGQALMTEFGVAIITAIIILVIGRWVAKGLSSLTHRAMEKAKVDPMLTRFVTNLVYFALLAFVVVAAISRLGVQTTSFIAVLGAAGLAVGLALQGSLSNMAAGVLIIIFRPYKIDDFIEGGGASGTVHDVQIFTTVLRSPDNQYIIVPNAVMMSGTITNYSTLPSRRLNIIARVAYGADMKHVRQVVTDILEADERVAKDPAPLIAVTEITESSVNVLVRCWPESANYWPLRFDLTERIKERFDAEGIDTPFPQQDVHVYEHEKVEASQH